SEEIQPIISDIRLAVTQARGFNHPALIAVDGWAGAGRDTIIGILKNGFPEYRITTLNLDNYRLPLDVSREDESISIPEIGDTSWSDIGIGIRRDNATTITVLTSFDETTMRLPAIGQEVKVADNAFYIKRDDIGNLNIRLASILKNVELGKFYKDIQNLREGKTIQVSTQGGTEEIDPNEYDIIFVKGGLSLHQESINTNYSLSLFVDAEFPVRIERSIREYIFDLMYSSDNMTVSELRSYMEAQRIDLEDQYLFEDRERADYVVINGFYPDESLLCEIYNMDLSERVDRAITVAWQDNVDSGWSVLKDYILPVTGVGSNFRTVIELMLVSHQEQLRSSPGEAGTNLLSDNIESFNILNSNEQNFLRNMLDRINLIGD
ncbi:MAG: hypothetical protein P9M06_07155, partial [Candidatus Saelkia tenebricola]|nr:hypothetical protein [Candidatus Saelkia tenebricola]